MEHSIPDPPASTEPARNRARENLQLDTDTRLGHSSIENLAAAVEIARRERNDALARAEAAEAALAALQPEADACAGDLNCLCGQRLLTHVTLRAGEGRSLFCPACGRRGDLFAVATDGTVVLHRTFGPTGVAGGYPLPTTAPRVVIGETL